MPVWVQFGYEFGCLRRIESELTMGFKLELQNILRFIQNKQLRYIYIFIILKLMFKFYIIKKLKENKKINFRVIINYTTLLFR